MWKTYRKRALTQLRPWTPEDPHQPNAAQIAEGSPKVGDMIARDPGNPQDEWLITEKFFKDNYDLVPE